jgi:hypothetical protein
VRLSHRLATLNAPAGPRERVVCNRLGQADQLFAALELREMLIGVGLGLAVNEWWLRKNLRSFSEAIERGAFGESRA